MRQIQVDKLTSDLCDIAVKAGLAVLRVYEGSNIDEARLADKPDDSPLTKADLASHQVICDGLGKLTPHIPVVSEEDSSSLNHRSPMGSFWLVDPLDGTKEFLARNGEFTVNIALINDGFPVWGVVCAPALGQTYWGGSTMGAFRRERDTVSRIHVSEPVRPGAIFRVVASKSHLNTETIAFIKRLGNANLVQAGSSLKFCRVAEGNADIYPRLSPTCEWDTAAAHAIVEGAGGYVYDTNGTRLRYGKPTLLNPNFIAASMLHGTLLRSS